MTESAGESAATVFKDRDSMRAKRRAIFRNVVFTVTTRFLEDTECVVSPVMLVDLQRCAIDRRGDWHISDAAVRTEYRSRYAMCAIE